MGDLGFGMSECRMSDVGCQMSDVGFGMSDFGFGKLFGGHSVAIRKKISCSFANPQSLTPESGSSQVAIGSPNS